MGLKWAAVNARVDELRLDAEQRARVTDLLSAIEEGALAAAAAAREESEG